MIPHIAYLTNPTLRMLPLPRNTPTVLGGHSAGNNEACLNNPKAVIKHRQL